MKKGFTLVELILTLMIVSVISLVISFFIWEGAKAYRFISVQKDLSLSSRAALNRIMREIKLSGLPGQIDIKQIPSSCKLKITSLDEESRVVRCRIVCASDGNKFAIESAAMIRNRKLK